MERFGHYAYKWRGRVVLVAVAIAVAAAIGGSSVFDAVKPFGFQDPDSESARATEALEDATGERPLPDVVLVVQPGGGSAGGVDAATERVGEELGRVPEVTRVVTAGEDSELISEDGRAGLVLGYLDADVDDIAAVGRNVEDELGDLPGVTAGGAAVTARQLNETTEDDLRRIELFAAPVLFLLLLFVFRGLVAAMLPLVVGVLSIVTTLALLRVLTELLEIDVFVINIVTGLGLGLAIDYSLFVITGFRDRLADGAPTGAAVRKTVGTLGRMIAFSGLTVAAALASLCVFPQRFLYSIGIGGAIVALTSALVCLTVLPALLAMLGPRVNALAPRRLQRTPSTARWAGFARFGLRHPASIAIVVVAVMVTAGLPFLRVELTRADASVLPSDSSAHRVDAMLKKRFATDPSARIIVVIEASAEDLGPAFTGAPAESDATPGVESVTHAMPAGSLSRVDVQLGVDPFSDRALDAVDVARDLRWGAPALVGGPPAELRDQRDSLADHLPAALAIIVISTVLLIFAMTRSLILPGLALLMNALTVSVAFGVLVFVFQDGRLEGGLDYVSQHALDTSMPILLFAVAFGLSTDYGLFLLQRISEERSRTSNEKQAIAAGVARSGRPITAAALLFAVAMGAFAFSNLIFIKEVAVGTAVAVLVDATLVRALLFPAVLGLLGSAAWWPARRPSRARP
ncbi:MAG TPA: MMPL family transporter [Solirubrobacterales bacterium]|nr:MMPL family transporter [Solirubrobacterales bacterium]